MTVIKKLTACLTALLMALQLCASAEVYSDVTPGSETAEAVEALSVLGVVSGMGDGTFEPDGALTRAQFAKIAVCLLGKADEAVAGTDAFSDVSSADWFSGYVAKAASEGIIEGYPDGSFGAYEKITYAQALTVIIRLLGYSAADVDYKWPKGYIEKAAVLKLTEGMEFDAESPISRGEAAKIIYRALFTDMKDGNELITRLDVKVYEDAVILALRSENPALGENDIQTSVGTFKKSGSFLPPVGYEGTLSVNGDGEIIGFIKNGSMREEKLIASRVYKETNSKNISILSDKGDVIEIDSETAVYKNGQKLTAKDIEGVTEGSTITLYYDGSEVEYAMLDEYILEGPKTAMTAKSIDGLFDIEDMSTLSVIRKGLKSTVSDIEKFDVCYYSAKTNTLYAYNDRVTGVYEEAYPIKSNVSEVKLSGKTYRLSTAQAISKLGENDGAFKIGERVTLLLDTEGSVCDAVDINSGDISLYGVVTGTTVELSEESGKEGRAEYYVNILMADGTEAKYRTDSDRYEDKAGLFCEVNFEDSYAKLTFPKEKRMTGKADMESMSVDNVKFASDYAILEYEDGTEEAADVRKIAISDIDGITLTSSNSVHAELNGRGEISVLYVKNASGNKYTYGVVIETPENKTGNYVILSGAEKHTLTGNYNSLTKGQAIGFYKGADGVDIKFLTKKEAAGIDFRSDNIIKVSGQSFILSDDAAAYAGRYVYELQAVSLDDVSSLTGAVTLYSDASQREGGKVRVITVLGN